MFLKAVLERHGNMPLLWMKWKKYSESIITNDFSAADFNVTEPGFAAV